MRMPTRESLQQGEVLQPVLMTEEWGSRTEGCWIGIIPLLLPTVISRARPSVIAQEKEKWFYGRETHRQDHRIHLMLFKGFSLKTHIVLFLTLGIWIDNFLRFYLFIFREGKGGREGEKHQCVVASGALPTGDLVCNPGMCPCWELNWQPFGSQASAQSPEPHQQVLDW